MNEHPLFRNILARGEVNWITPAGHGWPIRDYFAEGSELSRRDELRHTWIIQKSRKRTHFPTRTENDQFWDIPKVHPTFASADFVPYVLTDGWTDEHDFSDPSTQ